MSNAITYLKALITPNVKDPQEFILSCFRDIKDYRSDVFLDFMHNGRPAYQVKATCVGFNKNVARFYLRTSGIYAPAEDIRVECFFIIKKGNHKIPCNFTSSVTASIDKNSLIYVDIKMPKKITHQQRRNNVRIPLKKTDIPNFRLWTGKTIFEENSENSITWRPVTNDKFEIIDISAGGMMLDIIKNSSLAPKLRKDFTLLCTGNFYNSKKEEQNFALLAKVSRVILDEKSDWVTIGLQFYKWARITDTLTEWVTVGEDGVSFLGTWLAPFKIKNINKAK